MSLFSSAAGAESNDSADRVRKSEAVVHADLKEFRKTDRYERLLEARESASSMNPRDSHGALGKIDEASLKLQIEVLLALHDARDPHFDPKAKKNIVYLNIVPPLTPAPGVYMAGMKPKDIKDPTARKAYEDALAENERRKAKLEREMSLSRGVDYAVIDIWHFIRGFAEDSAEARKAAFRIVEASIADKALLKRITSDDSPGMTW